MSTLKGTTMHPRCRHMGACWDLLEWFQLFSTSQNTSQNSFSNFMKKHWVSLLYYCEDLSIDVSITNVGLILTKPGWFFWGMDTLGTDRQGFGILIWKHKKVQLKNSKLVVSCRSIAICLPRERGCITMKKSSTLIYMYVYIYIYIYIYIIYIYIHDSILPANLRIAEHA